MHRSLELDAPPPPPPLPPPLPAYPLSLMVSDSFDRIQVHAPIFEELDLVEVRAHGSVHLLAAASNFSRSSRLIASATAR